MTRRNAIVALLFIAGTAAALIAFAGDHHGYDLRVYRGAVRSWLAGGDLYGYVHPGVLHQGFTYPPFAAITLIPLAVLPLTLGAVLNQAATGLAITGTTWVVLRPLARCLSQPVWLVTTVGTCLVCLLEPVRDTMGFGQVNMYLVALIVGDLLLLGPDRRWSGIGVGLATAVKLTPGLFIVFLFLTGRRRAACTATSAAAAATLFALLVAPATSARFWLHTLHDTSRVGSFDEVSNQSLAGLLTRLLDVPTPPLLLWLPLIACVLTVGLHRACRAARCGNELAALALVGVTACLVSPISWTHHLWWVVPAVVVLIQDGLGYRRLASAVAALGVLAIFTFSLPEHVALGPTGHAVLGSVDWFGENAYVLVLLGLLLAMPVRAAVTEAERLASVTTGRAAPPVPVP